MQHNAVGLPTPEELRQLNQIHYTRIARDLGILYLLIIGSIQLGISYSSPLLIVFLFFLIGCFQNGMISWVHEGSHYNFHRNKKINDRFADFILGPFGISMNQYRWHHLAHHKYLGDPEGEVELMAWTSLRGKRLWKEIFKHLVGFYAIQILLRKKKFSRNGARFSPPPPRGVMSTLGFLIGNALIFLMCALQGKWYLYFILWIAPLFTVALLISNFRTIAEHQSDNLQGLVKMPPMSRTFHCGIIQRFLIAPVGFYYHYEHHLYPSIPYHRLPELRKILQEKKYFENVETVRTKGYFQMIWALTK